MRLVRYLTEELASDQLPQDAVVDLIYGLALLRRQSSKAMRALRGRCALQAPSLSRAQALRALQALVLMQQEGQQGDVEVWEDGGNEGLEINVDEIFEDILPSNGISSSQEGGSDTNLEAGGSSMESEGKLQGSSEMTLEDQLMLSLLNSAGSS